ncbi:PAQR family membrane homeostasis protein TrhA [Mangrovicella endophytica]|uniref:PAQR family membrane homeostasis protein TrhA n=1 Tax=Mangrovicella endophytica TaxID=2066697 RepID=UPI001FE23330|nr:hemolysin III family protein [Mangrovicella endophytica]
MTDLSRGTVAWNYTLAELWADGVVHVLGLLLVVAGAIAFAWRLAGNGTASEIAAVSIYLAALLLSTSASAAYNMWPVSTLKWLLRRLDHAAIYLLIAGTYTPFLVKTGIWWLLAGVWSVAIAGVALKLLRPGEFDRLSILLYLALGWSGVVVGRTIWLSLSGTVLWLIVAGGVVYSLGVIFHLAERLRFQNAIWHGFVLVAGCIHFAAVWCASTMAVAPLA